MCLNTFYHIMMNKEVYNTLIPSCFVHCNKSLLIKSSRKKIFHWGLGQLQYL